jgi:hypothetical protein
LDEANPVDRLEIITERLTAAGPCPVYRQSKDSSRKSCHGCGNELDFAINALITDFSNVNSTLGLYPCLREREKMLKASKNSVGGEGGAAAN